ncbi:MAG: hypothetical protein A4E72_00203 [Syntrophus sp. PtaU1.Bin208]|nr:MAG: hypothetical protein A4E72_00203 [Syntrophus sp. PtaU1.Bin208]
MGSIMNIHSIGTLQGLQNAVRPAGEGKSAPSSGTPTKVALLDSKTLPETSTALQEQSTEASSPVYARQEDPKSDPTVVHYPPFFPIATYQRPDLITKAGGVGETIQNSSQDEGIPSTASDNILQDKTTSAEISKANGEIFAFHGQTTRKEQPFIRAKQPGSILDIEV